MIPVTNNISLDESEVDFSFTKASGPGGQNVNKVETAVQLRFDVRNSESLPEPVKRRLMRLEANRINVDGDLVIEARTHRSQRRNREDAVERLVEIVRRAATPPKRRKKTKPSLASRRRRLEAKRRRSETKKLRKPPRRTE